MNDKERYKIIIKNILEIKNKVYKINELKEEIESCITRKEYNSPDYFTNQKPLQEALDELLKESSAYLDTKGQYFDKLIFGDIEISIHWRETSEEYKYKQFWDNLIRDYKDIDIQE